jgi:23S rRNA (cytidine1920-2'-O)/16S rRNA (cytidine1409-2'-O)-methyltransferase
VVAIEGTNARGLSAAQIPELPQAVVADVSFISLKLALPPALELAAAGAWLVALVKPQFEVGRGNVGKGGVVRNAAARTAALDDVVAWLSSVQGWSVIGQMESPIPGGDGNHEFLVAARKS